MSKARSALNKLGRKKWSWFHAAVFALLISFLLSGCMVGPDYTRMAPDAESDWVAEMEKGLNATRPKKERLSSWWTVFGDKTLTELEEKAVAGNLELKTAISRLRQARLSRGISRSDLLPGIGAEARARKQESSESMGTGSGGEVRDYFLAQFDASWELDVFGGIRRSVQAAQAEIEASRANVGDVLISLMSEVALNYFEVRTYQRRIGITRANIRAQKKIHELNVSRYQSGLAEEIAVQQSLRNLESSRSRISSLESELRAAKNRLAFLVGRPPGALEGLLGTVREVPVVPAEVAVGIPAEAMRRRPDIRRAERKLAAQTARIGAATAELYPKFHLLGSIGLEAVDAQKEAENEFFEPGSKFWSLGPGVSWNIFNGNSLRLNIELQTEKQEQALLEYESQVLQAREEIENALTAYAKEQERARFLEKSVSAAKRAEQLARDRYQAGLTEFDDVLDAQRSLLELQNELARSKGEVASNLARLYKALGGGWEYKQALLERADKKKRAGSLVDGSQQ